MKLLSSCGLFSRAPQAPRPPETLPARPPRPSVPGVAGKQRSSSRGRGASSRPHRPMQSMKASAAFLSGTKQGWVPSHLHGPSDAVSGRVVMGTVDWNAPLPIELLAEAPEGQHIGVTPAAEYEAASERSCREAAKEISPPPRLPPREPIIFASPAADPELGELLESLPYGLSSFPLSPKEVRR
jgi:hypothetical protein